MEYVISVDLGATNLRVGIVSEELKIVEVNRERTTKNDKDALLKQICRLIETLPYEEYNIKKVGISACGLIEHDYITILPNLGIRNFDLKGELESRFPFKVEIKNDANCTALAEATFGAAKDVRDSYFITVSSGIGGCLIANRKMIDLPFEIGHVLIKYGNGYEELEKVCSGNGIVKLCADKYLVVDHAGQFFDLVKDGNALALAIFDEWLEMLALFIANTQMEFNTDKIVLSGGVMKSADLFIDKLELKANKLIERFPLKPIKFALAEFDQDAGLMGGVSVALAIED